jgi:hypothetical protein
LNRQTLAAIEGSGVAKAQWNLLSVNRKIESLRLKVEINPRDM